MAAAVHARTGALGDGEDFDATTWRGIGLSGAVVSALVLIGFAATFSCVAVSRFGGQSLTKG